MAKECNYKIVPSVSQFKLMQKTCTKKSSEKCAKKCTFHSFAGPPLKTCIKNLLVVQKFVTKNSSKWRWGGGGQTAIMCHALPAADRRKNRVLSGLSISKIFRRSQPQPKLNLHLSSIPTAAAYTAKINFSTKCRVQ